jgi:hypothetical protein
VGRGARRCLPNHRGDVSRVRHRRQTRPTARRRSRREALRSRKDRPHRSASWRTNERREALGLREVLLERRRASSPAHGASLSIPWTRNLALALATTVASCSMAERRREARLGVSLDRSARPGATVERHGRREPNGALCLHPDPVAPSVPSRARGPAMTRRTPEQRFALRRPRRERPVFTGEHHPRRRVHFVL